MGMYQHNHWQGMMFGFNGLMIADVRERVRVKGGV